MIDIDLDFPLPAPWVDASFQTSYMGEINFLVGPNGSGKSQFARSLHNRLVQLQMHPRLLGTDRLAGMEQIDTFTSFRHNPFSDGFAKGEFQYIKEAGELGAGIDSIVLLEVWPETRFSPSRRFLNVDYRYNSG